MAAAITRDARTRALLAASTTIKKSIVAAPAVTHPAKPSPTSRLPIKITAQVPIGTTPRDTGCLTAALMPGSPETSRSSPPQALAMCGSTLTQMASTTAATAIQIGTPAVPFPIMRMVLSSTARVEVKRPTRPSQPTRLRTSGPTDCRLARIEAVTMAAVSGFGAASSALAKAIAAIAVPSRSSPMLITSG
jgi:hypothetical protein